MYVELSITYVPPVYVIVDVLEGNFVIHFETPTFRGSKLNDILFVIATILLLGGRIMTSRQGSRRASFIDVAAQQGRRPSVFEQAANLIQLHSAGNHSLAVLLNFTHLAVILVGLVLLPFFLPSYTLLLLAFPLLIVYYVTDFLSVWDPNWSLKVALRQYLFTQALRAVGTYQTWRFHRNSYNVRQVQEDTLHKFLKLNADTAYARDHNLGDVHDSAHLVRSQPFTKFPHYAAYVERMKNGEEKVLTKDPPLYFGKTSGTTGQPSVIPFTADTKRKQIGAIALFHWNADRQTPWEKLNRQRPIWKISYTPQSIMETTPCGVLMGPISANPFWTKLGEIYTSPTIVFQIDDAGAGGYVQLIFALRYRNLGAIEGIFSSLVYFAFKRIENEWESLVQDIRIGTIKRSLNISQNIRDELAKHLAPDEERARELEKEFAKGFDNIASRIWPELKIIDCITTGPFAIYSQYLRDKYTCDILQFPKAIVATEGIIACNFWPLISKSRFALLPEMFFYEFIPIEKSADPTPSTVLMDEVELGRDYELVLTMSSGFYRYRMGDVVRVVSFYNQVPVVEYRLRVTAQLGIRNERVTEVSIITCLNQAVKKYPAQIERLVDWTSVESPMLDLVGVTLEKAGAYHIIFVEFTSPLSDVELIAFMPEFSTTYDEFLRRNHYRYDELRRMESLAESVVWPIRQGGFERLREYMLKTSTTSPVQLKMPRVLVKKELLHFLVHERLVVS